MFGPRYLLTHVLSGCLFLLGIDKPQRRRFERSVDVQCEFMQAFESNFSIFTELWGTEEMTQWLKSLLSAWTPEFRSPVSPQRLGVAVHICDGRAQRTTEEDAWHRPLTSTYAHTYVVGKYSHSHNPHICIYQQTQKIKEFTKLWGSGSPCCCIKRETSWWLQS